VENAELVGARGGLAGVGECVLRPVLRESQPRPGRRAEHARRAARASR
jgi:hypothetical protein